jgi:hypothetical protein
MCYSSIRWSGCFSTLSIFQCRKTCVKTFQNTSTQANESTSTLQQSGWHLTHFHIRIVNKVDDYKFRCSGITLSSLLVISLLRHHIVIPFSEQLCNHKSCVFHAFFYHVSSFFSWYSYNTYVQSAVIWPYLELCSSE